MTAVRKPALLTNPIQGMSVHAEPIADAHRGTDRDRRAHRIELGRITADPDQPRQEFEPDSLARLAESLRRGGQLQPVRVWWDAEGDTFRLIAGERRWRAARLAGLSHLDCIVLDAKPPAAELLAEQLIENLHREELTPTEQARAFVRLLALRGWTQAELARELNLSEATVSRALPLAELAPSVAARVDSGQLPVRQAAELAALTEVAEQELLAEQVVKEGLDKAETRAAVRRLVRDKTSGTRSSGGGKRGLLTGTRRGRAANPNGKREVFTVELSARNGSGKVRVSFATAVTAARAAKALRAAAEELERGAGES